MEIAVALFVGILSAGATVYAAYIQRQRGNLDSAPLHQERYTEFTIKKANDTPVKKTTIRQPKEQVPRGEKLTIQARSAFSDDLGCDPIQGELLLFHRRGMFWDESSDEEIASKPKGSFIAHGVGDGWIIVTTHRLIVRVGKNVKGYWYWHSEYYRDLSDFVLRADQIREARIRVQSGAILLIESGKPTGWECKESVRFGKEIDRTIKRLYLQVKTGFFENAAAITNELLAILRSIAAQGVAVPIEFPIGTKLVVKKQ